jgi:hypothetical protein
LNLLQVPPPSSTRACHLPSASRHRAPHRAARVHDPAPARSRSRAGTTLSRERAPQHTRTPTRKARLDLWSLFLRRASPPRFCRPRRHDLAVVGCFAHAVAGEGAQPSWLPSARLATDRSFLARALVPTAVALPAATHGAGPSSAAVPAASPPLRTTPSLAAPFTLRARTPAHALARAFTCLRTGKGHPHHLPSTAAAPTSPCPHRRRPRRDGHHPLVCVPSSPATQGGPLRLSRRGRSPRRREASPPARSSRAAASLLSNSSNTLSYR